MINIIPKPYKFEFTGGNVELNCDTTIKTNFLKIVSNLNEYLLEFVGYSFVKGSFIKLELTESAVSDDEEYTLEINTDGIKISAPRENGLFYAIQSLKQLITAGKNGDKIILPAVKIYDKPRFKHRGFMLDCARHFFSVQEVKRLIEAVALHKMNIFHWHLVDDQGWRPEIRKYPSLTEIGGKRTETRGDKTPVEGYYTQNEIKEIVSFAKDRFIDIIPEIDVPGHASAMVASYPHLSCDGKQIPVETTFGIKPNLLCAGKETTFEFLKDVLDEIIELFPYEYIHLGGDEAVKTKWKTCPDCQKTIKEKNLRNEEDLQAYFTDIVISYLLSKGKKTIVWNEALNSGILNKNAVVQYWQDGNPPSRVIAAANAGRPTIISKFTPYYLDYPHGMHPLRSVYAFEPLINGITETDNIIGVETPVWTEHIAETEHLEKQTFPRLSAVAETAWSASEGKDLKDFKTRLNTLNNVLSVYKISYTDTQKSDINKIIGVLHTIRFFLKAIDLKGIPAFLRAAKEQKENRKKEN